MSIVNVPRLGEPAPAFTAAATRGPVRFPSDYQGRWVVLLSHPGAFDPLGAAELGAFAGLAPQFAARSCTLLAFSPDSLEAHAEWARQLGQNVPEGVNAVVPIVSDDGGLIGRAYGVIPAEPSAARPARGVFIVDPQSRVRVVLLYPREVPRDAAHILWLVSVLQQAGSAAAEESLVARQEAPAPVSVEVPAQAPVYPVVEAEPPARRQSSGHARQSAPSGMTQTGMTQTSTTQTGTTQTGTTQTGTAQTGTAQTSTAQTSTAQTGARQTGRAEEQPHMPAVRPSLRPVSQSVWDALAQARPYPAEEQQSAPAPTRQAEPPVPAQGSSAAAPSTLQPQQSRQQARRPAKPAPQPQAAGGASIAEQNRLLLGGLLDKETAENGGEDGGDYIILRDFPFQH